MADRQALRMLRSSVSEWNSFRQRSRADAPMAEGVDLRGSDLAGLELPDADLELAHLEGANLSRSNLRGADLSGSHLEDANLSSANLDGTQFAGAHWNDGTVWPVGFRAPQSESEDSHGVRRVRDLVTAKRVHQFSEDQRVGFVRTLEPLLTFGERLLEGGGLSATDERTLAHRLGQTRREVYENPDDPDPALVEQNLRRLVAVMSRLSSVADLRAAGLAEARDPEPVMLLLEAAAKPGNADSTAAGLDAVEMAGILEELVEPIDDRTTTAEAVLQLLRWGTGGAIAGMELQALVSWMPKPWAALVGAVVGLLGNAYETRDLGS